MICSLSHSSPSPPLNSHLSTKCNDIQCSDTQHSDTLIITLVRKTLSIMLFARRTLSIMIFARRTLSILIFSRRTLSVTIKNIIFNVTT
jgi:hypothetical protein